MNLTAETFRDGEYFDLAVAWWKAHHGITLGTPILSRFGCLVSSEKGPLAMTHIYLAKDAAIAWVGFTVTNPDLYYNKRVLDFLHEAAEHESKDNGCCCLFTAYDKASLQSSVERRGYFRGSKTVEFWKEL